MDKTRRVLYTDDDPDACDLISVVLKQEGFEVVCARNASEAIRLARSQDFDLYLMDSWLPDCSGTDLTRKLREFDAQTPVLFYSGAAYQADKEAARSAGAQGYIVKPASNQELIAEVVRLVAESKIAGPEVTRSGMFNERNRIAGSLQ